MPEFTINPTLLKVMNGPDDVYLLDVYPNQSSRGYKCFIWLVFAWDTLFLVSYGAILTICSQTHTAS